MFEKLKRKSLQKLTETYVSQRDRSDLNASLNTLGFLVDEALFNDFDQLYDFFHDFNLQPKNVKVFSFLEVKKKLPSLQQNQIQCKDFNWKGEMHNQNAAEFLDKDFDVLIGFYEGKQVFLDAMMARSKAKFKVGFFGMDQRLYDLILGVNPTEIETFKAELKKYLTIMNKVGEAAPRSAAGAI